MLDRPPPRSQTWPHPPRALPAARLAEPPQGARVTVAGLVLDRLLDPGFRPDGVRAGDQP